MPDQSSQEHSSPNSGVRKTFELENWQRTRAGDFDVYTNAPLKRVQSSVRRIEQLTNLVSRFVFGKDFEGAGSNSVLIFREKEQFEQFAGTRAAGHAITGSESASLAMYAGTGGSVERGILNHELVHIVTGSDRSRHFPSWFSEGIAEFFYGTTIQSDLASVGQVPVYRIDTVKETKPLSLARMFTAGTAIPTDMSRYYAYSWLFVHYGFLSEQMGGPRRIEQFWRYVELLSHRTPWRVAFEQAFDVPLEQVTKEFAQHRRRLLNAQLTPQGVFDVEIRDSPYAFELVDEEEIAQVLADHFIRIERYKLAAKLLDVVLEKSPDSPAPLNDRIRVAALLRDFDLADQLWDRLQALPAGASDRIAALTRARIAHERYRDMDVEEREKEGGPFRDQAQIAYREILATHPKRAETWADLGNTYVLDESSAPEPGIQALENALGLDLSSTPVARLDLAKLLIRRNDLKAARPHLNYVIAAYPTFEIADEARKLVRRHY